MPAQRQLAETAAKLDLTSARLSVVVAQFDKRNLWHDVREAIVAPFRRH